MTEQLLGLCSMATAGLLADLGDALRRRGPFSVRFESAGGVEVAQRVRDGARADLVVLSDESMRELDDQGLFAAGTLQPLFVSDVVAAVADDVATVPLSTEADLETALVRARRIAYSTGPSGTALVDLVSRWGLADLVAPKLAQAEPGTPVGTMLTNGEADLGFQQRSEFVSLPGVRVLGPLPGAAAIRSTFSGAVLATSAKPEAAAAVLGFLASRDAAECVRAAGMTAA